MTPARPVRSGCAVLGYGTIGTLLTRLLADGGTFPLVVANRTPERASGTLPPGATLSAGFSDAVAQAALVFLCVKPSACAPVLRSVAGQADDQTLLVSTAGDVSLERLRNLWPGPVVRMMPTVTAKVGRGVNLLCGQAGDTAKVREVFPGLRFWDVSEDHWNALAAVTSCGPGLVSAILAAWSQDLVDRGGLTAAEAEALVAETAAATLSLREDTGHDFLAILKTVASPGGVTGEGARVLGERLPGVWSEVAEAMDRRHQTREGEVGLTFGPDRSP